MPRTAPSSELRSALLLLCALATAPVAAADYVVDRLDEGPGSLRAAIEAANASTGRDTVRFAPGLSGTLSLQWGQIAISDSLEVIGPGRDVLAIDASHGSRLLHVAGDASNPVEVSISDLGLRRGAARSSGDGANGGAILLGQASLTLRRVQLGENVAENSGAAIYVDGGSLRVEDSLIAANRAGATSGAANGFGGGIAAQFATVAIARSRIEHNAAGRGGGLSLSSGSATEISDSVLDANEAQQGSAGAIYAFDTHRLRIERSALVDNASIVGEFGGGALDLQWSRDTWIVNTTISGNRVTSTADYATQFGGGIYANGASAITILHSTIVANRSQTSATRGSALGAGVLANLNAGSMTIDGSILAGNDHNGTNRDLWRTAGQVGAGYSLVQARNPTAINAGDEANQFGIDPDLLPLASNGGDTYTHALRPNSPARDAGRAESDYATDQRGGGYPRRWGAAVDIGAYEWVDDPVFRDGFERR